MLRQIAIAAALAACPAAFAQIPASDLPALEAGDILFKGAETGAGTRLAASWSLEDPRWGHVGIVVAGPDGALQVVHADTGKPGEIGAVRQVELATFLEDVSVLGIYEVALSGPWRQAYLGYAEAAVGSPFDRAFSLSSETSLYCSELVWRALSAGLGRDAVPEKSRRYGRTYVSLSDLSGNPLLREQASLTAGEAVRRAEQPEK